MQAGGVQKNVHMQQDHRPSSGSGERKELCLLRSAGDANINGGGLEGAASPVHEVVQGALQGWLALGHASSGAGARARKVRGHDGDVVTGSDFDWPQEAGGGGIKVGLGASRWVVVQVALDGLGVGHSETVDEGVLRCRGGGAGVTPSSAEQATGGPGGRVGEGPVGSSVPPEGESTVARGHRGLWALRGNAGAALRGGDPQDWDGWGEAALGRADGEGTYSEAQGLLGGTVLVVVGGHGRSCCSFLPVFGVGLGRQCASSCEERRAPASLYIVSRSASPALAPSLPHNPRFAREACGWLEF